MVSVRLTLTVLVYTFMLDGISAQNTSSSNVNQKKADNRMALAWALHPILGLIGTFLNSFILYMFYTERRSFIKPINAMIWYVIMLCIYCNNCEFCSILSCYNLESTEGKSSHSRLRLVSFHIIFFTSLYFIGWNVSTNYWFLPYMFHGRVTLWQQTLTCSPSC